MNFSIYKKSFGWIIPALMLTACAEDVDLNTGVIHNDGAVTIDLSVPDDIIAVLTRAEGDNDISDVPSSFPLIIAQYDNSGNCLKVEKLPENISLTDGKYSFPYVFEENAASAEFIGNLSESDISSLTGTGAKRAYELSTSEKVFWTSVPSSSFGTKGSVVNVQLVRNYAKVSLENSTSNFSPKNYEVYGTATTGTWGTQNGNLTLPSDVTYSSKTEGKNGRSATTTIMPVFETPASQQPFVIVEGTYNGKDYFYKVAFADREYKDTNNKGNSPSNENYPDEIPGNYTYTYKDIQRNHRYILKIDYVRAEGWEKLEDALKAEPDNRITAQITDVNEDITTIIACRDYAMGVSSSQLTVKGEATEVDFYVVHNYKKVNSENEEIFDYPEIIIPTSSWIKEFEITDSGNSEGLFKGDVANDGTFTKEQTGKKFKVTLKLEENTDSENSRVADITVKVGDLVTVIKVTQQARDYIRGADRKVTLFVPDANGNLVKVTDDYFAWIDRTDPDNFCYGVRPEDNGGVIRNDGLILAPVNMFAGNKSITYQIPKKNGEAARIRNNGTSNINDKIWVSDKGIYFQVEVDPSNNILVNDIGITDYLRLEILDSKDIPIITYKLYSTGFFHQLTDEMAGLQCPSISPQKGWYYYEFVKKSDYYITDRNIGATNNMPYISTYIGYRNYIGALGGYFRVADKRASATNDLNSAKFWEFRNISDGTILTALGLEKTYNNKKLHFPTQGELNQMGVNMGRPSKGVSGNSSYVATISDLDASSRVHDNCIYIPHGGYYEGETQKFPTSANLWTSTLYSETQGYHPNYNTFPNINYGFWYYYLDFQAKAEQESIFNQMRCTDATQDDFADAGLYRYMPLRLVWGVPNTSKVEVTKNTFKSGDQIEVRWVDNWWKGNVQSQYEKIYVYYKKNGESSLTKPCDVFDDTNNKYDSKDGNYCYKTFTVDGTADEINIIVHNGYNTDEMKYLITPTAIIYQSGDGAPDVCQLTKTSNTTYSVKLFKVD